MKVIFELCIMIALFAMIRSGIILCRAGCGDDYAFCCDFHCKGFFDSHDLKCRGDKTDHPCIMDCQDVFRNCSESCGSAVLGK